MEAKGLSAEGSWPRPPEALRGRLAAPVASPALTMGLAIFHPQRDRERVCQRQWKHAERQRETARPAEAKVAREKRQGRDPRGVSGVAGRAWRQAERLCAQAGNAQEAVPQLPAALAWFEAPGRLDGRQTAQAQLDAASPPRQGACWSKVKRLLREERTRRPVERLSAHRPAAVSDPVPRCLNALVVHERPETTGTRLRLPALTSTGRARASAG